MLLGVSILQALMTPHVPVVAQAASVPFVLDDPDAVAPVPAAPTETTDAVPLPEIPPEEVEADDPDMTAVMTLPLFLPPAVPTQHAMAPPVDAAAIGVAQPGPLQSAVPPSTGDAEQPPQAEAAPDDPQPALAASIAPATDTNTPPDATPPQPDAPADPPSAPPAPAPPADAPPPPRHTDAPEPLRRHAESVVQSHVQPDPAAITKDEGRVHVALHRSGEDWVVTVSADNPATLDLMRRNADILVQDLARQGFEGAQLDFSEWHEPDTSTPHDTNAPAGEGDLPAPAAIYHHVARLPSAGLDLRL